MKKFLMLAGSALCIAQLHAISSADKLIKFKDMELGHCSDWFDHAKRAHNTKHDLLRETQREWNSYSNQLLRDVSKNTDCSRDKKEEIFAERLNTAIELHKKQNEKFKKLCNNLWDEAMNIQKRHEKELEAFIESCNSCDK